MIKRALAELGLESFAVIGLVVFVVVFLGVVAWVLTRTRRQVDRWASLPLADGTDPLEPRDAAATARGDDHGHHDHHDHHHNHHGGDGCGKCAECTCAPPSLTTISPLTTTAAH